MIMSEHDVTSLRSISSDVTAHPADPSTVKVLSYIVTLFLLLLIKRPSDPQHRGQRSARACGRMTWSTSSSSGGSARLQPVIHLPSPSERRHKSPGLSGAEAPLTILTRSAVCCPRVSSWSPLAISLSDMLPASYPIIRLT